VTLSASFRTAVALVLLTGIAGAQSVVTDARAASVSGRAMVTNGNGLAPFALTRGFGLNPGDRVDTRGGGQVVIELNDGSMVVVQPESVVVLKDFRAAGSLRELFEIALGRVRVKINHFGGRPNPYRMNSPTASIAVRGTEFSVIVDAQGETQVEVYEGAVEVVSLSDPNRRALIEAGRGVVVRPGQDLRFFAPPPGGGMAERPGGPAGQGDPGDDRDRRALAANQPPGARPEMRANAAAPPPSAAEQGPGKGGGPPAPPPPPGQKPSAADNHAQQRTDADLNSPLATAGTYERYIAGLAEIGQTPFLLRFNAFPEAHLDSLENPAYASGFTRGEARIFFLPSFSQTPDYPRSTDLVSGGLQPSSYTLAPQFTLFTPVGKSGFVLGGSVAASRVGAGAQSPGSQISGSSTSNFWSGSLVAARRFGSGGHTSFGIEIEKLLGNGSLDNTAISTPAQGRTSTEFLLSHSDISQTRLTAGISHDFRGDHKLGLFYRYGLIDATDADRSHLRDAFMLPLDSTRSAGHSAEIGARLRGPLAHRLFYGLDASIVGISLDDALVRGGAPNSHQRDRSHREAFGMGLGYALSSRVILTFDAVGGISSLAARRLETATNRLLQNDNADDRFVSFHTAIQADLSRHLFVSGSLLAVMQTRNSGYSVFPDRFGNILPLGDSFFPIPASRYQAVGKYSDYGAGWRFSPDLFVQYLYSTDYGYTAGTHTIMLRYTIHFRKE
jgi:FecR protein